MPPGREYLAAHLRKDVGMFWSVLIAVTACVAAGCGGTSAIMTAQLSHYRKDPPIGGNWMAGLLFVFPALTGVAVAYKKRVMSLTSHLCITVMSVLLGWLATVYACLAIYQDTCVPFPKTGDCMKVPLMVLCLTTLIIAALMCATSLGVSMYTYRNILVMQEKLAIERKNEEDQERIKMRTDKKFGRENIAMDVKSPDRTISKTPGAEHSTRL